MAHELGIRKETLPVIKYCFHARCISRFNSEQLAAAHSMVAVRFLRGLHPPSSPGVDKLSRVDKHRTLAGSFYLLVPAPPPRRLPSHTITRESTTGLITPPALLKSSGICQVLSPSDLPPLGRPYV